MACACSKARYGMSSTGAGRHLKTYGPPRWQVGCVKLCSVVHKRIRRSGMLALAMMEIRASWSS